MTFQVSVFADGRDRAILTLFMKPVLKIVKTDWIDEFISETEKRNSSLYSLKKMTRDNSASKKFSKKIIQFSKW